MESLSKSDVKIEKILKSFIPVEERKWYPWEWPGAQAWYNLKNNKKVEFINHARQLALRDFFFFSDEVLRNIEYPHLCRKLHGEMCHLVEHGEDIVLLYPRNHLKSTILTEGYVLWRLVKNPNLRILIISETLKPVARSFLSIIRLQITENKRLKMMFPDLKPARITDEINKKFKNKPVWNSDEIVLERNMRLKEPSVTVAGARQTLTGMHYDLIIYDDIMTPKNARTEELIEDIKDKYDMSHNLLDMDSPTTVATTRMAGTRYRDNDVYGHIQDKGEKLFYVRAVIENGKYIWPNKNSIKRVEKMRKSMSQEMFAAQYYNDPIVKGHEAFQASWVKRWNIERVREEYLKDAPQRDDECREAFYHSLDIYMGMDPSRKPGVRSDFGVNLVLGVDTRGRKFCLDIFRARKFGYEMADIFVDYFKKWMKYRLKMTGIEVCGGDNTVFDLVKKKMKEEKLPYWKVIDFKTSRWVKSEERIMKLQQPFHDGMILLGEGIEWDDVEYELLRFPNGKHDDILVTMEYMESQLIKPKQKTVDPIDFGAWRNRKLGITRNRRGKMPAGSWMSR